MIIKPTSILLMLLVLAGCINTPSRDSASPVAPVQAQQEAQTLEEALRRAEREQGEDHPQVARILHDLAKLDTAAGRSVQAEQRLRRAVTIRQAAFGPGHPDVAATLSDLAWLYATQDRLGDAIVVIRQAARVQRVRVITERTLQAGGEGDYQPLAQDAILSRYVGIAWQLAQREPGLRNFMLDESFRAGQQIHANDVAAAVARVAARIAIGEDTLAGLVRDWLALVERRDEIDQALVTAANRPQAERDRAQEARLRDDLAATTNQLVNLNDDIALRFPEYKELTSPVPARVEEIQALLAPSEALLAYAVLQPDPEPGPGEEIYAWLVRRDRAEMWRLDLTPSELEGAVRRLRTQLDPNQWQTDTPPRFDAALAHWLHTKLLPANPALLTGIDRLLLVPDGALQSLPFAVLVRTEPRSDADYREVDWFARHYATVTLPSVSSLRVLRRLVEPAEAVRPFRGVGNPVLTGPTPGVERAMSVPTLVADGLADPAQVRSLPPLPETADELRELARNLGVGTDNLLLAEAARETAIKSGALARTRIVAFATHAGVAGELPGLAEPALVLTPPAVPSEEDDGVLTVSEVAKLRLDSDFVVLSACNTAAPDGKPGAPGLSGLAKSFLHAGSRSLLVSHWAVISEAAERLTTGMFAELSRDPGIGRAEALRRSEMALLDDPARPHLAHPAAWAPFVIVGQDRAGRGRTATARLGSGA